MREDKKRVSGIGVLAVAAIIIAMVAMVGCDSSEADSPESVASEEKKVLDRIKPLGEVATTTEEAQLASPKAEESAPVAAAGPMTPEKVYNTACMACHATGAADAPKVGDIAAWSPRIAKGNDVLFEHATKGFKAMPPRGGSSQLSDEDIRAAIKYMVEKSQ